MRVMISLLLCLLGQLYSGSAFSQQAPSKVDHELRVTARNGGPVLTIDGARVERAALSHYFAQSKSKGKIREASIRVILAPSLALDDYFQIKGLLHKIGFIDAHVYVASEDWGQMVEIGTVGQAVAVPRQ